MADYQVRGFHVWHHHLALVMVALMFLACKGLVEIMRHKLPTRINTDGNLVSLIENRPR